jgi:hypothetical protein
MNSEIRKCCKFSSLWWNHIRLRTSGGTRLWEFSYTLRNPENHCGRNYCDWLLTLYHSLEPIWKDKFFIRTIIFGNFVETECLTAVVMTIVVFWNVTVQSAESKACYLLGAYTLTLKMEPIFSSETSVVFQSADWLRAGRPRGREFESR